MLHDGASDLSSTGTITVTVCPCQSGGMWVEELKQQTDEKDIASVPDWERQTACLPSPSNAPLLGVSSAAMLAILACASTLLGQFCFSVRVVRFCDCCSPYAPPLYPTGLMMCCCFICPSLPIFIHHCLLACLQIAAFLPYLCVFWGVRTFRRPASLLLLRLSVRFANERVWVSFLHEVTHNKQHLMSAEGIVWHFEIAEQATLKVPQMTLNTQTLLKKSVRGGIGIFYKYTLSFTV